MAKTKKADDKIAQNQIMFDFVTEEVKVVVKKENSKTSRKSIKQNHIKKHRKINKILKGAILHVNRRNKKR